MELGLGRHELQTDMIQPQQAPVAEAVTSQIANWHDPASEVSRSFSCDDTNYKLA